MPELANGLRSFTRSLRAVSPTTDHLSVTDEHFKKVSASLGFKYLGDGEESVVVKLPNSKRALALQTINAHDARMGKMLFYAHRIYSIWFPGNYPKVHAIFYNKELKFSGSVREYVSSPRVLNPLSHLGLVKWIFDRQVLAMCSKTGIPLPPQDANHNFKIDIHGRVLYMDMLRDSPGGGSWAFNYTLRELVNNASVFQKKHQGRYSKEQQYRVDSSVNRLRALLDEEN